MIQKLGAKASTPAARSSSQPQPKKALKQAPAAAFKRDELSTGRGGALRARAAKYLGGTAAVRRPPPPGPAGAINAAHELFIKSTGNAGTIGGTVTDFRDATDLSFADAACAQLERNRLQEAKAQAALSPSDQAQYAALQKDLACDPAAQLALQTMLLEGRLPGAKDLVDGKTLLQQLTNLSNQEFDPKLEGADQLLAQTVREIFIPAGINQGPKGTCAATSSLAALATANPAAYVRLVAGLASPEGKVELANGQQLIREPGTVGDDGTGRSVAQRLLGPAAMEYANGLLDYDNETDQSAWVMGGLMPGMAAGLLEGLFGSDFSASNPLLGLVPAGQAVLAESALAAVDAGKTPVAVAMNWPELLKGHMLVIDRVERTDEGTFVVLRNPWGQEERVPYDDFQQHLNAVVTPS